MTQLLRQEFYKLSKQKSTWVLTILLIVQVLGFGYMSKSNHQYFPAETLFYTNFTATGWLTFIMIAFSAIIITSEFQYGTIKSLFYQKYSRSMILISKWLTMLIYSIFLYLLTAILSLLSIVIFSLNSVKIMDKFSTNQTNLQHWLTVLGANFVTLWLLLSLVFLLASIFKNSAVAISIGLVGYFALAVISGLMFLLIDKWNWLRWNPLNFINFGNQIQSVREMSKMTHLSNVEMLIGSLIYIAIFLIIGLLTFRKKEV